MSAALIDSSAHWLALALMAGVIAAAYGAATARSLFAMCMYVTTAAALAAAALLGLNAGDAALAQALLGVGIAPVLILAALLLSTRAAKPRKRGRPWLTIFAASAATGAVLWVMPGLTIEPPAPPQSASATQLAAWLAPLVFAAVAACVGLLGYGERGALDRSMRIERDQ